MKKAILMLGGAMLLLLNEVTAQRKCGAQDLKAAIIAKHPEAAQFFEQQKASLQGVADNYKQEQALQGAKKTTAASAIPVIFHIILKDSAQFNKLGGTAGITQRCDSQIAVLNYDYNRQNSDSVLIPSLWKPLYGSVGIHFGLAHTAPNGYGTPGYELIFNSAPFDFDFGDAKHASNGGLDAWDQNKYMNVWCINFSDNTLLGLTVPKSDATSGYSPASDVGICISYGVLGKRVSSADYFLPAGGLDPNYYDKGRTLTHETGHFLEIWHTWGDDGGACPWKGGSDDGIKDTPPEADAKYGMPIDTIPNGTIYDACVDSSTKNVQPIGVASLDFMNYTDDTSMLLFTPDQAAAMAAQVSPTGENYSLTQNPGLLNWPPNTGIAPTTLSRNVNIFPNPATNMVYVAIDLAGEVLNQINITNMIGQEVKNIDMEGQQKDFYSIDLSGMSKGIYFVRCNFASGSITRKITLQ